MKYCKTCQVELNANTRKSYSTNLLCTACNADRLAKRYEVADKAAWNERCKEPNRKWREANRDKAKKAVQAWRIKYPEKYKASLVRNAEQARTRYAAKKASQRASISSIGFDLGVSDFTCIWFVHQ